METKQLKMQAGPGLPELAATIREAHEAGLAATREGVAAIRKGLEHYRAAGNALLAAKAKVGHGEWLPWLKTVGIGQQRASEYMRLAEGWDNLPPGGTFTLKKALALLSAPSSDRDPGEEGEKGREGLPKGIPGDRPGPEQEPPRKPNPKGGKNPERPPLDLPDDGSLELGVVIFDKETAEEVEPAMGRLKKEWGIEDNTALVAKAIKHIDIKIRREASGRRMREGRRR